MPPEMPTRFMLRTESGMPRPIAPRLFGEHRLNDVFRMLVTVADRIVLYRNVPRGPGIYCDNYDFPLPQSFVRTGPELRCCSCIQWQMVRIYPDITAAHIAFWSNRRLEIWSLNSSLPWQRTLRVRFRTPPRSVYWQDERQPALVIGRKGYKSTFTQRPPKRWRWPWRETVLLTPLF